jgi:hypothetical protein
MEIWLTYGAAWVSENDFSNFEDLNLKKFQNSFNSFLSQFFLTLSTKE